MVIVIIMQPAAVAEPIKVMVVEADPAVEAVAVVNMAAVVVVILPVEIMLEVAETDPELAAACRLARRRRLGPYYAGDDRRERRAKHLGALARQGFNFDVARKVVDAPDLEALDALLSE